ncbi:MAG: hypothetical protein R3B68_07190 [Phycisphaerales bacterium]
MQIEPMPGLEPDQAEVHARLCDLVLDAPRADEAYDAIPESRSARIISVDIARYLIPEFRDRLFRIRHTPSTATPAGAYAHNRMLRTLTRGTTTPDGVVVFLAGGAGSGKTTSLASTADVVELAFDNQMLNPDRARVLLDAAADNGWQGVVTYVHRPFPLVVDGVIRRSVETGRWNRLHELPAMHMRAQQTFWELSSEYRTNPAVSWGVLENLGTPSSPTDVRPLSPLALRPGEPRRYQDVQSLRKVVDEQVRLAIQEGRFPEPLRTLCLGA